MTHDLHIRDSADLAQLPPHFDVSTWDVADSGELAPGLSVRTRWQPVAGRYETQVLADPDTYPSLWLLAAHSSNRNDAQAMQTLMVRHVQRVVALAEVG